jgi:hypothetical protein
MITVKGYTSPFYGFISHPTRALLPGNILIEQIYKDDITGTLSNEEIKP